MRFKIRLTSCAWIAALCLVFCPARGGAEDQQGSEVYTLAQSIAEALENNWSLKAQSLRIDQAMNVKKKARAEASVFAYSSFVTAADR